MYRFSASLVFSVSNFTWLRMFCCTGNTSMDHCLPIHRYSCSLASLRSLSGLLSLCSWEHEYKAHGSWSAYHLLNLKLFGLLQFPLVCHLLDCSHPFRFIVLQKLAETYH